VSYSIVMQTPQYQIDSLSALQTLPITATGNPQSPILAALPNQANDLHARGVDTHPVDGAIYATPQGATSSGPATWAGDCRYAKECEGLVGGPARPGADHDSAFSGLLSGCSQRLLIYFLIVVNFQSWSDPYVIITRCRQALPASSDLFTPDHLSVRR